MRKKAKALKKSLDLEMNPYYHAYNTATEFIKSKRLWEQYQDFAKQKEKTKGMKNVTNKPSE